MATDMSKAIPKNYKQLICHKLGTDFKNCTKVVAQDTPTLKPHQVLIRNRFVGINASDINFTAGKYAPGVAPPFPVGFEGIGDVVAVGEQAAAKCKVGQALAYLENGCFGEYFVLDAAKGIPMPAVKKDYIALMVSGLTAALAIDKVGDMKKTDTVLVTAAAGGTGQFAVQWAKAQGCTKVLGTCSSPDKVEFLKSIGCDRPINYKTENLADVLKKECPNGVDLVYESVGGQMFDTCVSNLSVGGRIIIIGAITGYKEGKIGDSPELAALPVKLLTKSASARGFFMPHFHSHIPEYMMKLVTMFEQGKLKAQSDLGESTGNPFKGVDDIVRAVEYLYSQNSVGKVVVEVNDADHATRL